MNENVIRFDDYERKSRNPDAVSPRNPADSAVIIILPMIRQFNEIPAREIAGRS
jgi:hypothetical protein